jgi:hypothetical protein
MAKAQMTVVDGVITYVEPITGAEVDFSVAQYGEGGPTSEDLRQVMAAVRGARPHLDEPLDPSSDPRIWLEPVLSQSVRSLPLSTLQLGKDTITPFLHPIQTANSLLSLGKGIIQLSTPGEQPDEATARAVGEFFAERYGGWEKAKRTIADDPAGFLADLSIPLTLGGSAVARIPGVLGKVGQGAAKAGHALDPLTLGVKGIGAVKDAVLEKAILPLLGAGTGQAAGPGLARAITGAVTHPGGAAARRADLWKGLRGGNNLMDSVLDLKKGLDEMKRMRGGAYNEALEALNMDRINIDMSDVIKGLQEVRTGMTEFFASADQQFGGSVFASSKEALAFLDEIDATVANWSSQSGGTITARQLDALKKQIDSTIGIPVNPGHGLAQTGGRAVVRDLLEERVPGYGEVMRPYKEAWDLQEEIIKDLSAGDRVAANTTLRKLLSVMRNNASTNFGFRQSFIELVENQTGVNILPKIVGGMQSELLPTGAMRYMGPLALGAGTAAGFPWESAALLPLMSPRGTGMLGAGIGTMERVLGPATTPTLRSTRLAGETARGAAAHMTAEEQAAASRPASYVMDVLLGRTGR